MVSRVNAEEESLAEDFEYKVNDDGESVTITKYKGEGGDVVIPKVIDGKKVTVIGIGSFSYCDSLTSVKIPDSVIRINSAEENQDGAFAHCASLKSVYMPNSLTVIGSRAFLRCTSLSSAEIPSSVTSIGRSAFLACKSLVSVEIPNGVTTISDGSFSACESLASVIIPNSVTLIEPSAFSSCDSLTSVKLPSSLTMIGPCAFGSCSSLKSIDVDEGNAYFTSVDGVLYNKEKDVLYQYPEGKEGTEYSISNIVKTIYECAFIDCTSLISIEVPNSVENIGSYAFSGCTSLKSVNIPDGLTRISACTFSGCSSLTSVKIPNSVTKIHLFAFSGCSSITSIEIPSGVTVIENGAFGSCTSLTSAVIPNSMTEIEYFAFGRCPSLTIYGNKGSTAQTYAQEYDIPFKIIGTEAAVDKESGVIIENPNLTGMTLEVIKPIASSKETVIYDITLKDEKEDEVQPKGEVTVKIPLPTDWKNSTVSRKESDGTLTDMKAVCKNGYAVFVTDHFSEYVLALKPEVQLGDINNDTQTNAVDAKMILQYASGSRKFDDKQLMAADVNGDGNVNAIDAKYILQYVSGSRDLS